MKHCTRYSVCVDLKLSKSTLTFSPIMEAVTMKIRSIFECEVDGGKLLSRTIHNPRVPGHVMKTIAGTTSRQSPGETRCLLAPNRVSESKQTQVLVR